MNAPKATAPCSDLKLSGINRELDEFSQFLDQWPSDAEYAKWCEDWLAVCIRSLSGLRL